MEKNRYQIMFEQIQEHAHKHDLPPTEIIEVFRKAAHIIRKNRIVIKESRYGDTVRLEALRLG